MTSIFVDKGELVERIPPEGQQYGDIYEVIVPNVEPIGERYVLGSIVLRNIHAPYDAVIVHWNEFSNHFRWAESMPKECYQSYFRKYTD